MAEVGCPRRLCAALALGVVVAMPLAAAVDYDIVYVRQPRSGDQTITRWPEVFHPAHGEPGADLMLLHPNGGEEVLVAGGAGAVTDPYVSFDGQWVYYSYFPDLRSQSLNFQRDDLPIAGADIYRIHVPTRRIERLTHGEFTPNSGAGVWDESNPIDPPAGRNRLGYGILNLGPCPVPGGRVAFTSNRNAFVPPKGYTSVTLQPFVMEEDGSNVTLIAPLVISSALHPTILRDGRLMFSSHESQGLRDSRMWGLWAIYPDGRRWAPLVSAFNDAQAFHFQTQLTGGDLVVVDYYNLNNNGFGALYRFPLDVPPGQPRFGSAVRSENPPIEQTVGQGFSYPRYMSFTPWGLHSIVPFTHGNDEAAPVGTSGVRVGKFTHPSGAPGGDLLVVWTPGPANHLDRPTPLPSYDGGIYLHPGGAVLTSPGRLVAMVNSPAYNEAWPRALVPYAAIYGVSEPARLPFLPNDGSEHTALPAGTPYGLIGTSTFYKRDSFPGAVSPWDDEFDGLDAWNTNENGQSSNWFTQGADAGRYQNSAIWAVRVLLMEPNTHRSYGPHEGREFYNHAGERLRILGEIPLRKQAASGAALLDPEGNPDTSFLARLPADTPFTFQTLDRDGLALNTSQTWHQVRPGEVRTDCGGCHAHSKLPLAFDQTAAGQPGFAPVDLVAQTPLLTKDAAGATVLRSRSGPLDVEFIRDIRPLLARSCVPCHTRNNPAPPGRLVLDDTTPHHNLPGDYARLAADPDAAFGHPPVISSRWWRQTNASRYLRMFQSRRSLVVWKVFGRRLDGWSNQDHPTETTPGDPATLPQGAEANDADVDFTGTIMPPPGSGVPALSEDEKMTFARWVDLGAPIDLGPYGWFLDDLRPTLTVSEPNQRELDHRLAEIRFAFADANSGVDPASLSVVATFPVAGRPPGAQLADLAQPLGGDRFRIALGADLLLGDARVDVQVRDLQGNTTRVERRFRVRSVIFADGFEAGGTMMWGGG